MTREDFKAKIEPLSTGVGREIEYVHRDAFDAESLRYTIYQSDKVSNYIEECLASPSHEFFGLIVDGAMVGYSHTRYLEQEAHLNNLAVIRSWQGRGGGDRLLRNLVARAGERGCKRVSLNVDEGQERIQKWYENQGFEMAFLRFSLFFQGLRV